MQGPIAAMGLSISAIVHATEDPSKVARAMTDLVGDGVAKSAGHKATGHYGNEIRVLQINVKGSARAERILSNLWAKLSPTDREDVLANLDKHTDQTGRLFLRIDKQEAYEGRVRIGQAEPLKVEITFDMRTVQRHQVTRAILGRLRGLTISS